MRHDGDVVDDAAGVSPKRPCPTRPRTDQERVTGSDRSMCCAGWSGRAHGHQTIVKVQYVRDSWTVDVSLLASRAASRACKSRLSSRRCARRRALWTLFGGEYLAPPASDESSVSRNRGARRVGDGRLHRNRSRRRAPERRRYPCSLNSPLQTCPRSGWFDNRLQTLARSPGDWGSRVG